MAFWFEAAHPYFFEHSDGANVVIETLGSDHLDPLRLKGPGDETMRHLGSIPLPLIFGNDVVANLHHACLVRPAPESHAADSYLVSCMDDDPIPDAACRIFLHRLNKEGSRFCHIRPWPGVRNMDPKYFRQFRFLA